MALQANLTFAALTFLREEFSLEELECDFFCKRQGKGVADGIGGQLKSQARRLLLAKTAPNIQNAREFYCFIKSKQQAVKVSTIYLVKPLTKKKR